MKKVRFTRRVREKLRDLGWEKHYAYKKKDVVKYGDGKYSKAFGFVWITLLIRDHYVDNFQTAILCQTSDLELATKVADNLKQGIQEVQNLHFFDN